MPEAVFSAQPPRTHPTTLSHVPSCYHRVIPCLTNLHGDSKLCPLSSSCALPLLLTAELLLGSEAIPRVLMELCDSWALLEVVGVADVVTRSLLVK